MWRALTARCDGGAHDNGAIVDRILVLRHERANLLGYASYADYALEDSMAKTPAIRCHLSQPGRHRSGARLRRVSWQIHGALDRRPPNPIGAGAARSLIATIAPRHGLTHFTHVFDGGYAGAYYSYRWSEVLDADAFEAFSASGDIFNPELAARFRREALAPGNSRDPMASFIAFRCLPPEEYALLHDRRLA
jgi:Zn-dependent oligopeptidase